MADFKFTSKFIIDKLQQLYPPDKYAFFEELRIGTGFGKDSEQRLDGYAIHYLKGQRNATTAFEVKVSRADFFSEIKKPLKRKAGLRLSHHFYFVTPKDLVTIEEVPPECGLITIDENGIPETVIKAPYRESMPTWQFMAAISRRLDVVRRKELLLNARIRSELEESAVRVTLYRYINKWKDHNIGSREFPDKILEVLGDLLRGVDEIIDGQSKKRMDE